ncbi:MAG: DUF3472 domain-containing protein [Verrucomicrobiota bacterium]
MKIPALLVLLSAAGLSAGELRIPTHAAYLDPEHAASPVGWNGPDLALSWFGEIRTPGEIHASVELEIPAGKRSRLRLSVGGISHEAVATGTGKAAAVSFGGFEIPKAGYVSFRLESLNPRGEANGEPGALLLDGPAAEGARFNLKPRRNAASVHLSYPNPGGANVAAFYVEATAAADPPATYYMAAGWHRGYFGMQVISPTERNIIFSVWDSGSEAVSRDKVGETDRVTLVAKGEGVNVRDFGNEGTGGHSHLIHPWKTGSTQRFIVTALPVDATHTVYSGFWFHPDQGKWMLISSWKTPKDGGWLHGLYSFSENFNGNSGHLTRKAWFGNQWVRDDRGTWIELTRAGFSHDETGKADRLDRFMGVEQGRFFLSQGGFVEGFTKAGETFDRPATGRPPEIELPVIPR